MFSNDSMKQLIDSGLAICDESIKSVNKVKAKKNSSNADKKENVKTLVHDAIEYFQCADTNIDSSNSLKYIESAIKYMIIADKEMENMKIKYSPAREITYCLLDFILSIDYEERRMENGIFIPFPSPENLFGLLKNIFRKGGDYCAEKR